MNRSSAALLLATFTLALATCHKARSQGQQPSAAEIHAARNAAQAEAKGAGNSSVR